MHTVHVIMLVSCQDVKELDNNYYYAEMNQIDLRNTNYWI